MRKNEKLKEEIRFILDCLGTAEDTLVRYPELEERNKTGAISDDDFLQFKTAWIEDVQKKIRHAKNSVEKIEVIVGEED